MLDYIPNPFKKGMIILWSGSIASIPGGWALCDGDNGTPDLYEKFVYGAGSGVDPGETGGSDEHAHGHTAASHSHNLGSGSDLDDGFEYDKTTGADSPMFDILDEYHMPPYFALAYIMKL